MTDKKKGRERTVADLPKDFKRKRPDEIIAEIDACLAEVEK